MIPGSNHSYKIRDIFQTFYPEYLDQHPVSIEKQKVANALMNCRTGGYGYTLIHCESCGETKAIPCSCGNRNCPSCGKLRQLQWAEDRKAEVIRGIPYFHLVFTLPHELTPLIYHNQKNLLNLFFHAVTDSIIGLCEEKKHFIPGILLVLHSFGSNLSLHYHLHVIVTGGGLTRDRSAFRQVSSHKFFLPVKALASVYRGKWLAGLKSLRKCNRLSFSGDAVKYRNRYEWKELLDLCYRKDWNIEIKPLTTSKSCRKDVESIDNAISYVARYADRTAISDSRIRHYDKDNVTFSYKSYHGSSYEMKEMTLTGEEFIRRFLMHILPKGFSRIRSAGILASSVKNKNLKRIAELRNTEYVSPERKTAGEQMASLFQRDIFHCPHCKKEYTILPRIKKHPLLSRIIDDS